MKKFFSDTYLDGLFVATVASLFLSVLFTFITGESPFEAAGLDPAIGTIGMGSLILALLVVPVLVRRMRDQ
jgi:hypothetical protein